MSLRFIWSALVALSLIWSGGQVFASDIQIPRDMSTASKSFLHMTMFDLNPENCAEKLKGIYEAIYTLKPDHFSEHQDILQDNLAKNPIHAFFRARLELRNQFKKWVWDDQFESYQQVKECGKYLKIATRTLRTFEDYWGQVRLTKKGTLDKKVEKFDSTWPHLMVGGKYKGSYSFESSLKSGDILLSRGSAFSGAVISRIGNVDNQFSHLAIVYIDEGGLLMGSPGQVYVVESVLKKGLQIIPMEEYMKENKSRIVHFRYVADGMQIEKNLDEIRKAAAYLIAQKAKAGNVPYNFAMRMGDTDALFCSQAVSYAYSGACDQLGDLCPLPSKHPNHRIYQFPLVYTDLPIQKNPLVQLLGIDEPEVFAPADIEIDPQIELVAEWRDYSQIEGRRIHDMALTKMFQWMEVGGYRLKITDTAADVSKLGHIMVKATGQMPKETPEGYVKGTVLLGYMLENKGYRWDLIKGLLTNVESISDESVVEVIQLLDNTLSDTQARALVEVVKPALKTLSKDDRLEKIVTYVGFSQRLNQFAQAYQRKHGLPPTDYRFDLAMEGIRIKSCKDFKSGQRVRFHDFFAQNFEDKDKACDENKIYDWRDLW